MTVLGWRVYFPAAGIRFGGVALIALGLQLLVIYSGLGDLAFLRRVLFVISYLLLFLFVFANWRRLGILIIGVGLLLNFLAIAANGGLMPVTAETMREAGLAERIEGLEAGDPIPLTKDVLLDKESTRLWVLSDILMWDNPANIRAFSIGDVIIFGGLVITLLDLFLPRIRRARSNPFGSPPP